MNIILNPDAYLAAFLTFHGALPTALDVNLPDALYNATAFHLANPVPFASYEYVTAFADMIKLGQPAQGLSLTAISQITPEVWAYFKELTTKPVYAAEAVNYEHHEEPVMMIGIKFDKMGHFE